MNSKPLNISPYVYPGCFNSFTKMTDRQKADLIISQIYRHFDISPSDELGKTKQYKYCYARQLAMVFIRNMTELCYREIGLCFSNRTYDHSTIVQNVRTINNRAQYEDEVKHDIKALEEKIDSAILKYRF
jgi:chromosomal replication initiation ATPase DnaA